MALIQMSTVEEATHALIVSTNKSIILKFNSVSVCLYVLNHKQECQETEN